jgi:hypothetical protein
MVVNIEDKIHRCRKGVDEIKASQLLGESNYVSYNYYEESELVVQGSASWADFNFTITYKANEDAFTIALFEIEIYVDGVKDSFGQVKNEFGWSYKSSLFPSLSYDYSVMQNVNYVNVGRIVAYLGSYSYEETAQSWVGKRVRLCVRAKASRPGILTITQS